MLLNHYNITRECCHYVADHLEDISVRMLTIVEMFVHEVEVPFLHFDRSVIRHPSVLATVKVSLFGVSRAK